jgi:type IV secretory pathway TraG/TraD family ATPase VirD4
MNLKMYLYLCVGFLLSHCLIALCVSYYVFAEQWSILIQYVVGSLINFQMPLDAKAPALSLLRYTFVFFGLTGVVWLLYPFALHCFAKRARRQSADDYISGAKLLEETELIAQIRSDREEVSLQFGKIAVPRSAEVKHTLIVGRPGSGKTVSISRNLEVLKERKGKLIIYDFKGDYVSKFYDPAVDIIFNPLDGRGIDWNIFSEISIKTDIPAIAHSLISPASQQDPFWNDAARAVFGGILHYLCQSNQRSNTAIWEMVSSKTEAITHILADIPEGREGYTYIQDASSKQAMSVAAVLMQYTSCFQYMGPGYSNFAISAWLHDDRPGWIFVSNYADIQDTLRPVLSLFVDILSRKLLSMTDDHDRRIFFFLDEFGTLQRLSSIKNLLTLSRSKGGLLL